MQQFEWIHGARLALAIVLEITANVLLKFSDGFRRKIYGILSLAAVLGAFSAPVAGGKRYRPVRRLCAVGRIRDCGHHCRWLDPLWSASEP